MKGQLEESLRSSGYEVVDFAKAGIHVEALGDQLQVEGAASFVKSWNELLLCIASKSEALKAA